MQLLVCVFLLAATANAELQEKWKQKRFAEFESTFTSGMISLVEPDIPLQQYPPYDTQNMFDLSTDFGSEDTEDSSLNTNKSPSSTVDTPSFIKTYKSQNNVKTKGITYTKEVKIPIFKPYGVPVIKEVKVPVIKPVAYQVDTPFPIYVKKIIKVPVYKAVPYKVIKNVPFKVPIPLKVPVETPIPIPIEKPVPYEVRVPIKVAEPKPFAVYKEIPVKY